MVQNKKPRKPTAAKSTIPKDIPKLETNTQQSEEEPTTNVSYTQQSEEEPTTNVSYTQQSEEEPTTNVSYATNPEDITTKTETKPEKTWYQCPKCRYKTTIKEQKHCPIDNQILFPIKNK